MPSGYTAIWALFTDWCAATGHRALPADPATVTAFLTDCPAAPETRRRRVAAIDHHHTATGLDRPGESIRGAGRAGPAHRRTSQDPSTDTAAAVDAALRALPSHGWTHGMFGRRDRCLLVLSQLAGVPYKALATVTAGDVTLVDGTATIRYAGGGVDASSGRRRPGVRGVRGRPVAGGPAGGGHPGRHRRGRRAAEGRAGGDRSITARLPDTARSWRRRPGGRRCCRRSTSGARCRSRRHR